MRPSLLLRAVSLQTALVLALPLLLPAQSGAGRPLGAERPDLVALADRVFAPWNTTHGPGCAVGIAQGGQTLLTRGYGMADLAGERPITPATILESGSVAKQFTAMAVLLLMQDGKLRLDDDARTYLPELPTYGRPITIRHLLTHTSGLREWSNLVEWQGWPRGTRVHTQDVVFDLITRQRALNYPVGDYYSYTNSGFLLLRTLVERVSGESFSAFTTRRLFVPLGLTHTRWRADFTIVVPGLAQAYARRADGWHLDMPNDNIIGAGGLLTTVDDWLRWNDALTAKTLGAAAVDSMTRQMTLTSGRTIQYALGLMVMRYRGTREIAHSGSTAGYSTYLARYPELGNLSIAVLCNAAGANATAYTHALVDAIAPSLPATPAPDTVRAAPARMTALRGMYRDTRTNTTVQLDTVGGQLRRVGGAVLQPLRDGGWQMGSSRVGFTLTATGAPTAMHQPTADGDTVVFAFMAAQPWQPTPAELATLVGQYHNAEIDATYTVAVSGSASGVRLTLSPRVGVVDTLVPTYRDAFTMSGGSAWFTRDPKGRVIRLHFGSARGWDFVLDRVR